MIRFDAIKIGDRSSKDGRSITFRIHHADEETDGVREIVNAYAGSKWALWASPLDDDGNPVDQPEEALGTEPNTQDFEQPAADPERPPREF